MNIRRRVQVSGLTATAALGTVIVVVAMASIPLRGRPYGFLYDLFMFHNGPAAIVLLWMSRLVLRRQPRHGAGLVLLATGVLSAAHVSVAALIDARLFAAESTWLSTGTRCWYRRSSRWMPRSCSC